MVRERIDRTLCAENHMTHYGSGLPVFQGDIRQDGYGLGALLMRFAGPLLRPIVQSVGKNLISSGGKILSNVVRRGVPMLAEKVTEKLFGSSSKQSSSTPTGNDELDDGYPGDEEMKMRRLQRQRRIVSTKKSKTNRDVGGRRKRRRVVDILD